jgi:hypothetical protein
MESPIGNAVPLASITNPIAAGLLQGGKWTDLGNSSAPVVLTYSFYNGDGFWTVGQEAAFRSALQAWSNVANVTFVEITGTTTQSFQTAASDIAAIQLSSLNSYGISGLSLFPDPAFTNSVYGDLSTIAGHAVNRSNYAHPEGDVFLNAVDPSFSNLTPGGRGLDVYIHELGHALGLKHPFDDGGNARPTFASLGLTDDRYHTVMTYDEAASLSRGHEATPMIDDIVAIQYLYGANAAYHSGDDIYLLTADHALRTIWDGGGFNVLSAIGQTSDATIDLRSGGMSTLASSSDTAVIIAYNVSIQEGIGGSGYNTIIGNDLGDTLLGGPSGNTLIGGAGNDALIGGAGSDLIIGGGNTISTLLLGGTLSPGRIGADWHLAGIGDLNGTGGGDLFWQRDSTGQLALWHFTGDQITGASLTNGRIGNEWHGVGLMDLNGDGLSDVLWRNDAGQTVYWQMSGSTVTVGAFTTGSIGADWHYAGSGDFNGDGKADILWGNNAGQLAVWEMNGYQVIGAALLGSTMGAGWNFAGIGDVNGDGKADILWSHAQTVGTLNTLAEGRIDVWTMNGLSLAADSEINTSTPNSVGTPASPTWQVGAVADFNGDGRADILWTASNGAQHLWLTNGLNLPTVQTMNGAMIGSEWHLAAARDLTGSGTSDLIWTRADNLIAIWNLGGTGDTVTTAGGRDTIRFTSLGDAGKAISDFQAGAGGDLLDLHLVLQSIGYHGAAPLSDGEIRTVQAGTDAFVQVDSHSGAHDWVTLATLHGVDHNALTHDNFLF